MRKPKVENKYNLKPKDIQKAIVLDYERLKQPPFRRNNVVQAWCLSETTIKNRKDAEFGCYNEYWIGFYDEDAKSYAGKIRLSCSSYGGMCHYNFKSFFNPKEIDCEIDLEIQEKLLSRINWLIDEGIIEISEDVKEMEYMKKIHCETEVICDFKCETCNSKDCIFREKEYKGNK